MIDKSKLTQLEIDEFAKEDKEIAEMARNGPKFGIIRMNELLNTKSNESQGNSSTNNETI